MERDQLREISSNGVLGRIARGVATSTGVVSGANSDLIQQISTSEPDNMDFHPVEINTIPGQQNINANNGEGRKQKTKQEKIIFDGDVMWTLWKKPPSGDNSGMPEELCEEDAKKMRKILHKVCRSMDTPKGRKRLPRVDIVKKDPNNIDNQYLSHEEFLKQLESISPFTISPDDAQWKTYSFVKNPNPFVMYLFCYTFNMLERPDQKKVRFAIYAGSTKYMFGDVDSEKFTTEYHMNYGGAIRRKQFRLNRYFQ